MSAGEAPMSLPSLQVDFVINCFERNYRQLLEPGAFTRLAEAHNYAFAERTLLINNVQNLGHAEAMAREALRRGEITRFRTVAPLLPAALARTGLSFRSIARLRHFSDCCLVAVTLPGPDWVLYWDADARLRQRVDWLSPTLAYVLAHPEVAICNPAWWREGEALSEALYCEGPFAIGYGISDVVFLARRSELARPIYRYVAPASWRYPLAAVEPIFEQRLDAYMRRRGRLRATYLCATYDHVTQEGADYSHRFGPRSLLRLIIQSLSSRVLSRLSDHPAFRI